MSLNLMMLVLFAWCGLIAWFDWTQRRIPNTLVVAGFAVAFLAVAFNGQTPFGASPLHCILGALAGLLVFLPLYAARIMGAGDVKLFSAAGALLGVWALLPVWLVASLLAALHALVVASSSRLVPRFAVASREGAFGRLPYGAHLGVGILCVALKPELITGLSLGLLK